MPVPPNVETDRPEPARELSHDVRQHCHGLPQLDARLEPWMGTMLGDPQACADLVAQYGSPLNLHDFSALARNAAELTDAATASGATARIFVARKANKTLGLVEAAQSLGLGVDVGSHRELSQVLDLGVDSARVIVTAAVKPEPLLRLALDSGVLLALDNLDEADAVGKLVAPGADHRIALRLAPSPDDLIAPTRFGESLATWTAWLDRHLDEPEGMRIEGVHFHLHGYDGTARVRALREALHLIDALRDRGYKPSFIDIGGGVPMSYLDDADQWQAFLAARERGQGDDGGELTWRGEPLRQFYPYHQSPVRGQWLTDLLTADVSPGTTVAAALAERSLDMHLEPGRSMLDGCGLTLARVVQRTTTSDGIGLLGLEMNRTQCRSTSDDFLVDPILVPAGSARSTPFAGYLVGAYCVEAELILRRRFAFNSGVAVGDVVALPNTAGYLMHILESASHQLPLASNLVATDRGFARDGIDYVATTRADER